jgi:non-ribosomal peptide synthase protein (TIGR01720 family)
VGLFTQRYPVLLDIEGATLPEDVLGNVRDSLRQVPRYGTGYGILRYLCDDPEIRKKMHSLPAAQISFSYLEQFSYVEQDEHALGSFELVNLNPEPAPGSAGGDNEALAIRACCRNDRLQMAVSFKPDRFRVQAAEEFAGSCLAALRSLIDARESIGTPRLTPSDFPLAGLSQSDLDDLIAEFGEAVE